MNKTPNFENIHIGTFLTFYDLVRYGTVVLTARHTNKTIQKVMRSIDLLEYHLGSSILVRNRKGLELTEFGKKVYEFATLVHQYFENKNLSLLDKTPIIKEFHVFCMLSFFRTFMAEPIEEISELHPRLDFILEMYKQDMVDDFSLYDVVIGPKLVARSDIAKYPLFNFTYGYYCSQKYINKYGIPKKIEDLANHRIITHTFEYFEIDKIKSNFSTDSFLASYSMMKAGLGIAALCNEEMDLLKKSVDYIRIFPETIAGTIDICLMHPIKTTKKQLIEEFLSIIKKHVTLKIKKDQ